MRLACYGFLGSGNLGNDASFETVRHWVLSRRPGTLLSAITIAPEAFTEKYGIPARPLRTGRSRVADIALALRAAGSADVVLVPGMGVMEETLGVRFWGLPYWLLLIAVAVRVRRRRFVLLAIGAEPVRNALTRWMFRTTARLASYVSYRDGFSAESMAGAGRPGDVLPDVAFAHPARSAARRGDVVPGRVVVGVLDYYGWADDRTTGRDDHRRYVDRMTEVVERLLDAGDHVVLTGGDDVDAGVAGEVRDLVAARRPSPAIEVTTAGDYAELVALMATASGVIGTRFHNLVAALSIGRPTVAVAYAEKAAQLVAGFGLEGCTQQIDSIDPEALVRRLDEIRADPAVTTRLSDVADRYAAEVHAALERAASTGRPGAPALGET